MSIVSWKTPSMMFAKLLGRWCRTSGAGNAARGDRMVSARRTVRLSLETLEERLTPSTLIPIADRRDLVFDPLRKYLYITTGGGKVQRWDVVHQKLLTPFSVGNTLEGAD